jgi:hypothetical protein
MIYFPSRYNLLTGPDDRHASRPAHILPPGGSMPGKYRALMKTAAAVLLSFALCPIIFSQDAGTLISDGWKAVEGKEYDEAYTRFKEAIQKDPSNGWSHRAAGWILKEHLKRPTDSLPYYKKAIALLPDEPLFSLEEALALSDCGNYNSAMASFDTALAKFKKQGKNAPDWVYPTIGYICRDKLKNPRRSLPYVQEGIKLYPDKPGAYLELGLAQGSLSDFFPALDNFTRALAMYRKDKETPPSWLLVTIAACHLYNCEPKSPDKAVPYLEDVLRGPCSPEDRDTARDWLAYARYAMKQWDDYVPRAKDYIRDGKNIQAVKAHSDRLSNYYFNLGDFEQAQLYGKLRGDDFWITRVLSPRTIVLKGSFHLKKIMAEYHRGTRPGLMAVPMPMNTAYQNFVSLTASQPYVKIEKEGRYNLAYFDFSKGFPDIFTVAITVKNRTVSERPAVLHSCEPGDSGPGYYVKCSEPYFDCDNPALMSGVKEITKNCATDTDRALALHRWVSANVKHILTLPQFQKKMPDGTVVFNAAMIPQYGRISEIYRRKIGHCRHITNLFTGMCRAARLPVRMIWGITISADTGKNTGVCQEHYVAEMYDPAKDSWFYVEPQDARFFGVNQFWHIIFSTDELETRRSDLLDLVNLRWIEFYNYGNEGCMTYSASTTK